MSKQSNKNSETICKSEKSKQSGLLVTISFVILLISTAVMMFAFGTDKKSIEKENRAIAQMPSTDIENILSGNFSKEFESYLSDHVGFRGDIQTASKNISALTGPECKDGKFLKYQKDIGTSMTDDTMLLYHDYTLMEIFYANEKAENNYVSALKKIKKSANKNSKCYSMMIPTQLEFDKPYYSDIQTSQKSTIDRIYKNLGDDFTCVNAYDALKSKSNEYIYFRSDHHWTQLGAYYAYKEYCKSAGIKAVDIEDYNKNIFKTTSKTTKMLGSLYQYTGYSKMKKKPDRIEWYDTDTDNVIDVVCKGRDNNKLTTYKGILFDVGGKTPSYSFYMGGDHHYIKLVNPNADNERTLLLIRDSYANAMIPWLVCNYKNVIVYDPRAALDSFSDLIAGERIDDILVMNYVFSSAFEDFCESLEKVAQKLEESQNAITVDEGQVLVHYNEKYAEMFYDVAPNSNGFTRGIVSATSILGDNVDKYLMLVPTSAVYSEIPIGDSKSEQERVINRVYDDLGNLIKKIDVYNPLMQHKNEYIYYKTDHHWTQLGAYYAYVEFCKSAGLEPVDIKKYKKETSGEMLGDLYNLKPERDAEKNPDKIEWFNTDEDNNIVLTAYGVTDTGEVNEYSVPLFDTDKLPKYTVFCGGDHDFLKVENKKLKNGKTLLLSKDSVANAMIPWLACNYKTILVYDPVRAISSLPTLIKDERIDDFLELNYLCSIASDSYRLNMLSLADMLSEAKK